MRKAAALLPVVVLSACWKDDLAEIPPDVLQFRPEVEAPADWLVAPLDVNLECPDGTKSRFYLLYPKSAAESGEALPAAVLYHSGPFDFVYAPDATDPLVGTHHATPSRLSSEWAFRQVFVTLGMYPEQDDTEDHQGLLPAALAEAGVAVMLPANCWGDLWRNKRGGADNDFAGDFFFREGRAAAEWSYRFLVDPAFAAAFDVELPIVVDPAQTYAIGLGEGGRAVAELLSIDNDDDGTPDYPVAGAVVDSSPDDLRVYYDDPGLYASLLTGLDRVFPGGEADTRSGSMWAAPLPDVVGYAYSTADPTLGPPELHAAAADRIGGAQGWVYESDEERHVLLNGGGDLALARDVVAWLTGGDAPPSR